MSAVKNIEPLTPKAMEFCAKYGNRFLIESQSGKEITIVSTLTNTRIKCEVREDGNYIDGEKVNW